MRTKEKAIFCVSNQIYLEGYGRKKWSIEWIVVNYIYWFYGGNLIRMILLNEH